ncbi:PQQ-binding-like beta-propeller repeat protein [Streptomyces sp. NPDC050610]|uniref:outer membrane protein assembly factor BamB family protein n=1 Tax=Streptomyces sp. NPDC050610 TaxID=3157097 RepID=UPI0034428AF4
MNTPQDAPIFIQPPPSGPRPGRTRLIAMLVAASVVLASAVAAGVWLLLSPSPEVGQQDSGAGQQSKAQLPWSLPYTKSGREQPTMVRGLWFTDRFVVKALPDGIAGLDRGTGKRVWGTPTPGVGSVVCQASTDDSDGIAVLASGVGEECSTFFAIDLASGKVLWEHELAQDEWVRESGTRIARSGNTVVVNAKTRKTTAFRVSDGKKLWTDSKAVYGGHDCKGTGYTGGRQLIRLQRCYSDDPDAIGAPYDVAAVDPASGHTRWTYRLGEDGVLTKVLATSPVVIGESPRDSGMRLTVIDGGKRRSSLAAGPERQLSGSGRGDGSPDTAVQIAGDTITVVADKLKTDSNENNKIIGWSLSSGKRLWEHTAQGKLQSYHAVASDTGDLLAYVSGNRYDPASLVKLDPKNGRQSIVHKYEPSPKGKPWIGADPLALVDRKVLYLSVGFGFEVRGIGTEPDERSLIALPAA